ncbi:MAG: hypothetical protein JXA25_00480 [Anaerolineales bacterium]|nr:hypothetical protein [Anaerolineales bacterium]
MDKNKRLLSLILLLIPLILTGCDPVVTDINVSCISTNLINAINTANSSPVTTTTLHLDPGCIYELSDPAAIDTSTPPYSFGVGLPEIVSPILINGQGATIQRSQTSGTPEFRIFLINSSGSLTLSNLSIAGGNVQADYGLGGAVLNYGELAINGSTIFGNTAWQGGAIHNEGTLTVSDALLNSNESEISGGGIHNEGELTIENTLFEQNQSHAGGALYNMNKAATVDTSTFTNNRAVVRGSIPGYGGAICNTTGEGSPTVGVMYVRDSSFSNNTGGHGGAINNNRLSSISISDSLFHANHAMYGGALFSSENMSVYYSALWENTADVSGGALYYLNESEDFGTSIVSSTLSGNSITDPNSTPDNGSAISHIRGNLEINYSTIAMNAGNPAYVMNGGTVIIRNSIIARNTNGDCGGTAISSLEVDGSVNIDSDGSCPGFMLTGNPQLAPLADNGGNTKTHALQINSPVLDAATGSCPLEDQRHESRPSGPACDLGAYESHDFVYDPFPDNPDYPTILETEAFPVPEEPHEEPNWWWKFEGFVCSESGLTEFYLNTDANPELFSLTVNDFPVICYQQSFDQQRFWCHVERVMLEWEIPTKINFCVEDLCETIERTTLSQARCEGDHPPTEPEPQDCSTFTTSGDCNAAPGCAWQCSDQAAALECSCVPE